MALTLAIVFVYTFLASAIVLDAVLPPAKRNVR